MGRGGEGGVGQVNDRFRVSVLFRFCKMRTTIWFFFLSFYLFSLLILFFFLLRPGQKRRSFFFLPFFFVLWDLFFFSGLSFLLAFFFIYLIVNSLRGSTVNCVWGGGDGVGGSGLVRLGVFCVFFFSLFIFY